MGQTLVIPILLTFAMIRKLKFGCAFVSWKSLWCPFLESEHHKLNAQLEPVSVNSTLTGICDLCNLRVVLLEDIVSKSERSQYETMNEFLIFSRIFCGTICWTICVARRTCSTRQVFRPHFFASSRLLYQNCVERSKKVKNCRLNVSFRILEA